MRILRLTICVLLFAVCFSVSAKADIVHLKNGETIRGRALDRDAYVLVVKKYGSVRIPKVEIARVELEGDDTVTRRDLDVVVLKSGREIAGEARYSEDERWVILKNRYVEARYKRDDVKTIRWADEEGGSEEAPRAKAALEEIVQGLLARLGSEDPEERKAARVELWDMGLFAIPYLEKAREDAPSKIQGTIDEILELNALREVLSPSITMQVEDIYRRLLDPDPEVRIACVQEIVLLDPEGAAPLLRYLASESDKVEVRALAVAQLGKLGKNRDLVQLLEESKDGQIRLAAAIALGDNGVYAGVPVLLSALRMPEEKIRTMAVTKLRKWTGQFFGYFPDDPEESYEKAAGQWEEWWKRNGEAIVEQSIKATVDQDEISAEEKKEGIKYWKLGDETWNRVQGLKKENDENRQFEVEKAKYYFEKAIEAYPTFANARLSLAILLYVELKKFSEAETQFRILLDRYGPILSPFSQRVAHFHLGKIYALTKKFHHAEIAFRNALKVDGDFTDAHIEIGRLHLAQALLREKMKRETRHALFQNALKAFDEALQTIKTHRKDLTTSAKNVILSTRSRPFEGGIYKDSVRAAENLLKQREARVQFARGRTLAGLQRSKEALEAYRRATELAETNEAYERAYEGYRKLVAILEKEEEEPEESSEEEESTESPSEEESESSPEEEEAAEMSEEEQKLAQANNLLRVALDLKDKKRHREAVLAVERVLEIDAGQALAYQIRGTCRIKLGELSPGLIDLARAVELTPAYVDGFDRELEKMAFALDIKKVLGELPSPDKAHLAFLHGRLTQIEAGRSESPKALRLEALGHFEKAVELEPEFAGAHLQLALLRTHLERKGAASALRKALEAGYEPGERLKTGEELAPLRKLEEFEALLKEFETRPAEEKTSESTEKKPESDDSPAEEK